MQRFLLQGAVLLLLAGVAACRPSFDRVVETHAVHTAVVRSMFQEGIQLHKDIGGAMVAIGNRTTPDRVMDGTSAAWSPKKLGEQLHEDWQSALSDYMKRRTVATDVRGPAGLPHELVILSKFQRDDWTKWHEAGGVIQLSEVGFDVTGTRALLYVQHSCGGLCGTGQFVCLSRDSAAWRVTQVLLAVIS